MFEMVVEGFKLLNDLCEGCGYFLEFYVQFKLE